MDDYSAENILQAIASRSVIDQALAILMAGNVRSTDEAHQLLIRTSQHENRSSATSPPR